MNDFDRIMSGISPRAVPRREMLRRIGIGAGGASMAGLLAACGVEGESEQPAAKGKDPLSTAKVAGELNFANWPAYIDKAKGGSPTLEQFEKATDIDVQYKEVINDNLSFYATIREPLASGQPVQWDLIVVTDWLIGKMADLGYLEELDHSKLPNFTKNAGAIYKDPTYDPNNAHSVPWQSGITGIAYNRELTGREITKTEDLFDPAFEGQVGMMTEMRDTMNLVILSMGINPEEATLEDARAAQEKLLKQREDGILRQYYGNDYVQPLAQGDLALCMAWSGDVLGKTLGSDSKVDFIVPEEGGMLWTDCMAIPQDAEHPVDALEMMNFVYQTDVAAQMTAWINYISPVPAAKPILAKANDSYTRQVADSPLVFPSKDMESRLHSYKNLDPEEEEEWNDLFNEVIEG
ncbi:MAG: spermidine/putrescine ABC transporter substrate-binding protein [Actinobacteria bacterium]|nr:spermidine/putrescine ABC transporter substrate-binding protein [Actinomycetota bacterium]MDQ3533590.1 spermidine/putrescine ABC transporter substrate-binding protein [Actinomycetota bacterium]